MARCAGGNACNCIIQPGPGLGSTGNGSVSNPQVLSVRTSRDAANCARFGSDGGLYVPCSQDEAQDICGISVGNLPEEKLVFGRGGAGRLLAPDHTMASLKRAVELGIDGAHLHVRELSDGTPVCFPSTSVSNQTGRANLSLADLGVGGYKNLPIRSGWSDSSTTNLGGRHGFFGFGESDQLGGVTLAEVLATVGRRAVLLLQMLPPYSASFPDRVLRLIYRYCAHEATIVGALDPDDLELFITSDIPTCVFAETQEHADLNPPSLLQERGIEWFSGRLGAVTTAQFLGYAAAGIQSLPFMANRHHDWVYLDEIGARGCISDDALYMTMDSSRYRSRTMAERLDYPQVQPGLLGYWTDSRRNLPSGPGQPGEVYWPGQGRGFYYPYQHSSGAAAAFYMPGRMATSPPEPSGVPYRTPSGTFDVSMGFVNPIPEEWGDAYEIEVDVSFRDTPSTNRSTGMLLCLPDDRAFEDRFDAGDPYWVVGLSWNGQVFVERWASGTLQAEQRTPGPQLAEDTFYRVRATVRPESITMAKLNASGAVQTSAIVTDSTLRGRYTSWYKKETTPTGTWDPFAVAWRNLVLRQLP